ncbi:MAG: ABC transporter [Chloroflexi bacterium RBG_13_53_26]|nr:MAG: ABC transporter [Chloroflexi bacterium RBG_13_53_26]
MVTVEAVAKHFKSGDTLVRAVDGVSVKLPKGKLIAIKGASGSGKTTLLNMIGALDKPSEGTIVVDGTRVSEMHGGEEVSYRRKKVGFVFQSYSLIPNLTALENVMLPMEITGVEPNGRKDRARLLLQRVRIDDGQQARRPTRLSGGEQQRVAIARALANDPPIILADEPTGNLDSKTSKRIVELLYSLTQEGKTVIVATHSADIAARADMVLEMTDGKVTDTSSFERPKR